MFKKTTFFNRSLAALTVALLLTACQVECPAPPACHQSAPLTGAGLGAPEETDLDAYQ